MSIIVYITLLTLLSLICDVNGLISPANNRIVRQQFQESNFRLHPHTFGKDPNQPLTFRQEILRVLPVGGFLLSLGGVCFQIFVLYPWHEELSK